MAHAPATVPEVVVKSMDEEKNKIEFILSNADASIANCLRKAIISEVNILVLHSRLLSCVGLACAQLLKHSQDT